MDDNVVELPEELLRWMNSTVTELQALAHVMSRFREFLVEGGFELPAAEAAVLQWLVIFLQGSDT